jgi:hypothetical protein
MAVKIGQKLDKINSVQLVGLETLKRRRIWQD